MYHEKDKTLCSPFTGRGAGLGFLHRLRRSAAYHWRAIRKWFVEQLNSKRPKDKPVQKVDVKRSEMMAALAKIDKDGKFTAGDGRDVDDHGSEESWYWLILSDPSAWSAWPNKTVDAVALTPENLMKYGPIYLIKEEHLYRINEYDIVTRVIDGKTYAAMYIHLEKAHS